MSRAEICQPRCLEWPWCPCAFPSSEPDLVNAPPATKSGICDFCLTLFTGESCGCGRTKGQVYAADLVNAPPHHLIGGIETIDFLRAKLSAAEFRGYLKGNVLKYVAREGHKGGLADQQRDLEKAVWYLDRLCEENNHER